MFSTIKIKAIISIFACLFFIELSTTQKAISQSSLVDTVNSSYFFGVYGGYNGLFTGSRLTEKASGTDLIKGASIGFSFEYKLPNTISYIQILSESTQMNFKTEVSDSYQILRFTTIGLKFHPKNVENLYLTLGSGIITGSDINTQMIMSFNLGYDIIKGNNSSIFIQMGTYIADTKDNFITFRFGFRLNL